MGIPRTRVATDPASPARRLRRVKVFTVVGNRPQFIKAAPLSAALRDVGIDEVVLHTGQHWYHDALAGVLRPARSRRAAVPPGSTHRRRRADAARDRRADRRASRPTSCSSTATRTRRSRAREQQRTRRFRSLTSRRDSAAATSRCPRSTPGSRPTASRGCSSARTSARVARSKTRASWGGSTSSAT